MTPEELEYRKQAAKEIRDLKSRVTVLEENMWTLNDHLGKTRERADQKIAQLTALVEKMQGVHGR